MRFEIYTYPSPTLSLSSNQNDSSANQSSRCCATVTEKLRLFRMRQVIAMKFWYICLVLWENVALRERSLRQKGLRSSPGGGRTLRNSAPSSTVDYNSIGSRFRSNLDVHALRPHLIAIWRERELWRTEGKKSRPSNGSANRRKERQASSGVERRDFSASAVRWSLEFGFQSPLRTCRHHLWTVCGWGEKTLEVRFRTP